LNKNFKINNEDNKTIIDISGTWNYELDSEDKGISEQWYNKALSNTGFILPGTTNENKIGTPLNMEEKINKDTVRCFRARYQYIGAAWYQREFIIPIEWADKNVNLLLERVIEISTVWVDGKEVGIRNSLATSHSYNITNYVVPGKKQVLTIRIDNRDKYKLGTYSHSYTEETQSIWNGIVGKIQLEAYDKIFFKDIKVFPSIEDKKVRVKAVIVNETEKACQGTIVVEAKSINSDIVHKVQGKEFKVELLSGERDYEFYYEMGEAVQLWDEFSPVVYNLDISIESQIGNKTYCDERAITLGMREFKVIDNHFYINNRKVFLRGNLECCIFPRTGYPAMDVEEWIRIFNIVKAYGLNHVRFHSWCPPEVAFYAADLLGLYLQIEGPIWLDTWIIPVGSQPEHHPYLQEECIRIIEAHGNHPSFCLFSNGNELNGDFQLLHNIVEKLKEINPHIVYTLTSNYDRPLDSNDDFFVSVAAEGQRIRGNSFKDIMGESTVLDYSEAVRLRNTVPIVSHEIGQFCVYPNIEEIDKYTGLLRPLNFEVIKNDLIEKGMVERASTYTLASGKLAVQLYKEEIEAALRTKDFGGYQLLGIQDFPGQCTATVGILDSFWESKGLIEPEEFADFSGCVVPLLRLSKRIYSNRDSFSAQVEIAHFGPKDFQDAEVRWEIKDEVKEVLFSGSFSHLNIDTGTNSKIGSIETLDFSNIEEAKKLTIIVSVKNTSYKNSWDIWVYPEMVDVNINNLKFKNNILITSTLNEEVEQVLNRGGKVLLLPKEHSFVNKEIFKGKFYPVFWSPVFFESNDPCGIYCDEKHDIFNRFPTDFYSSYQWKYLLENSLSVSLDGLPKDFQPIVEVVPNFFNNHRLSNLLEARVGEGKLMICSIDFDKVETSRVEGRNLKSSILNYMCGHGFNPSQELDMEHVRSIFIGHETLEKIDEKEARESFIKEDDL
jgi:hypothetical protein